MAEVSIDGAQVAPTWRMHEFSADYVKAPNMLDIDYEVAFRL